MNQIYPLLLLFNAGKNQIKIKSKEHEQWGKGIDLISKINTQSNANYQNKQVIKSKTNSNE